MFWEDKGYLISKSKYNENNIIAEFYTEYHGKKSGLIFGATSKKIKNYLQIGNKLYLNYNYKTDTKLGYFKSEIFSGVLKNIIFSSSHFCFIFFQSSLDNSHR